MELKSYQQTVIKNLESYLSYIDKHQSPAKAFNQYWEDKVGIYNPLTEEGMRPYKDNIPGAVHIAIKVPTAGGKTFIACNALHTIDKHFTQGNSKAVVWLVPWSNLLEQTVQNLSNPAHPYRQKLNSLFANRVEVYEKEQLLQGANFNPTSVLEQLNIFVFNFSSLRINSRKKDDRKVFQENGALEAFRNTIVDTDLVLPNTDETALINVIRSLNPIVVVDESHNAESNLSVEMLQNLNPSLVLDLTATPKENSNIISFVSALELKKHNMVKLPVVIYNHQKREEVINSALHLRRQLEAWAEKEEENTGKYIRPIILFQAQSNIKGKNNTTFQKIKDKLIKLKIPEEQIKIKVSGTDELKGIDLKDKNCPVRYIITINALKEGWDCPNAYILASLADKSSAVDVEQILGRVLRQPYVVKHKHELLNMSFVLTASSKFTETLDNIVKGLQESGFSKEDYYAEEQEIILPDVKEEDIQQNLFEDKGEEKPSDDDFDTSVIEYNGEDEINLDDFVKEDENPVKYITDVAVEEGKAFEDKVKEQEVDDTATIFSEVMNKPLSTYKMRSEFEKVATFLKLPKFYRKLEENTLHQKSFFEELNQDQLLHKRSLLDGFKLANADSNIDFKKLAVEIYEADIQKGNAIAIAKVNQKKRDRLAHFILSLPQEDQVKQVSGEIVAKLGDMQPISEQELVTYVTRIIKGNIEKEIQIRDLIDHQPMYVRAIKAKIRTLLDGHSKIQFGELLAANQIILKPTFSFPEKIKPINTSTAIAKSLYEREGKMNTDEQRMIMEIAALDNVLFWHRNFEKGKGFNLNGYNLHHYPDFIVYTQKGNLILVETKGDVFDNADSKNKNELGQAWMEKAGNNYKYFMVFYNKKVPNTYTASSIIDVIKKL